MRARSLLRNLARLIIVGSPALAIGLLSREGRADATRTSSLAWVRLDGAEACVPAPALARAVEARLGRKVFVSAADADITLEGTIGRASPSGYRATLRVTGRDGALLGVREVETRSPKCDAIDAKLALVVSVLIDPDAEMAPSSEAPLPAPPVPPPPQIIEKERIVVLREKAPADAPRSRWRVALGLGAIGSVGLQPDVGFGVAPSIMVLPPTLFAIVLSGGMTSTTATAAERGASVEGSFAHGALEICPFVVERGSLRALACAGGLAGALRSRGVGFDTTQSKSSLTLGPMASARVSYALVGPLEAALGVSVIVPVAQAELAYLTPSGESSVFRTAPVAGAVHLALGVRLP